jgi:antitoxin (DNA-binding transcriptional repressor) of toxin-antitoxin stability system
LLTLIQNGTEIILMDGEKPLARVLPIEGRRIAGLSRGAIRTSDDFDEPLDDSF